MHSSADPAIMQGGDKKGPKMTKNMWSFRNAKTGRFRACRLAHLDDFYDDPMTVACGVDTSEFVNDWRKRDIREGCPRCRADVAENMSEPDVMARWELR